MSSASGRLGSWGERQARLHLEARGYRIVATNYRCRAGEVDIVASEGDELVFVEVKTRRGNAYGRPEESITDAKAERLVAAAEDFLQSISGGQYHSSTAWRIDLVCLDLDRRGRLMSINHIQHAVEL